MKTGGGPASDLKLTNFERRGLAVWGYPKVQDVPSVEEADLNLGNLAGPRTDVNSEDEEINMQPVPEGELTFENYTLDDSIPSPISSNPFPKYLSLDLNPVSENSQSPTPSSSKIHKKRPYSSIPKPIKDMATRMIKNNIKSKNNLVNAINKFTDMYKEIETKKIKVKEEAAENAKRQLDFEIAKFKYLHPDFSF